MKETEVVVTAPHKTVAPTPLDEVTDKLKELEIPQNLEREIVIIGDLVFSVIKEHLALFSKDVVKLEPMDDLPSGIFPAAHYQVRLFIENDSLRVNEELSGWNDNDIYSTTLETLPPQFGLSLPKSSDYKIVFGEVGIDTSINMNLGPNNLPSKPVNFSVFNTTQNTISQIRQRIIHKF